MRSALLALLLLGPAFTGCLDGSFLEQIRNDLDAEDEYEERNLLAEEVGFSPAGIVDPDKAIEDESDVSAAWNTTVTVPEGARDLTVLFSVAFATPEAPDELPVNPPDGEVRVYVLTPGGDERSLTRSEPAEAGFDFTGPAPGEWTVGMEARGNGTVTFTVDAIVPIQPAS